MASVPETFGGGISDHYCLKWSNFSHHVVEILTVLLKTQSVDITLCAGREKILAHQAVLCAYSSYFKDILAQVNDPHPVVILPGKSAQDVSGILEFLYCGEFNVEAKRISAVLEVAESLQIGTLIEVISHLRDFSLTNDELSAADLKDVADISLLELAATDVV